MIRRLYVRITEERIHWKQEKVRAWLRDEEEANSDDQIVLHESGSGLLLILTQISFLNPQTTDQALRQATHCFVISGELPAAETGVLL